VQVHYRSNRSASGRLAPYRLQWEGSGQPVPTRSRRVNALWVVPTPAKGTGDKKRARPGRIGLSFERARRCGAPSHFGLGCPTLGPSQHLDSRLWRQGLRGPVAVEPSQRQKALIIRVPAGQVQEPA
jgi:hypothetical protein